MRRFRANATVVTVLAVLLAGCEESPEERYREAADELQEAREEVAETAETVEERREKLAEMEQELAEAEQRLAEAREQLVQAREQAAQLVTDDILFRTIQEALLEDERFEEAAIAVGVQNRVVTLSGTVQDQETRRAALETAREQPGVRDVRSNIRVESPDRPAENGRQNSEPR